MYKKIILLFISSIFLYTLYIRIFKFIGQYERELGPSSHKNKNGTITMGGILFAGIPLLFICYDEGIIPIIFTTISYAILGFIDDLLIVIRKNNRGIPALIKLIIQIVIAGISFWMYLSLDMPTVLDLKLIQIDIKWIFGMLILGLLTSSTNAFNITDGIDGLCAGLSILIHITFIIISIYKLELNITLFLIITLIPLFVFWCFNYPKAFLFMGDTGSLYLGSIYAIISIYLNCLLGYLILSLIFIFETLSVIIQVSYFKATKGKRIFKMAPFHHHLQMSGLSEPKIVAIYSAITSCIGVFCVIFYLL